MEQKEQKRRKSNLIYSLYEKLDKEERRRFLKRFGLFHALFLDPDLDARMKQVNRLIRYNIDDPLTKKMLINLERFIRYENRVILIDCNTLYDRIVASYNGLYDVVDRNDNLLVLAQADADKEQELKSLQERKEKGYCNSDLFAVDFKLVKTVIPKLLDEYRRTTLEVPDGMTSGEWDTILREIIWLCNEYVTEFKNKGSEGYEERMSNAKKYFAENFDKLV